MSASVDYIFSKLIQEHLIHDWKANDFWIKIQDYGVESNEKNRQRLYRLLRKHVGQQRFVKKTNSFNRKLSSYSETSQLALLRSKLSEQTIYLELKRSYCQIWCMAFRPLSLLIARLPACHS